MEKRELLEKRTDDKFLLVDPNTIAVSCTDNWDDDYRWTAHSSRPWINGFEQKMNDVDTLKKPTLDPTMLFGVIKSLRTQYYAQRTKAQAGLFD